MVDLLARRTVLKVSALVGGGLALDLALPVGANAASAPATLNAYVSITREGAITILGKNPEMGQGIKVALPMIVADELDADWADVTIAQAPFDPRLYPAQFSGGSMSVQLGWMAMRRAGAVARDLLVRAAAERWHVPVAELATGKSRVLHAASGRSLRYGDLADAAAQLKPADPASLKLKSADQFTIQGTRQKSQDTPRIVRGEPLFGIDTRLPGMLHAVFVAPPAHGARLKSADLAAARAAPGVRHVLQIGAVPVTGTFGGGVDHLPDGVAIIATNWWLAEQARSKLVLEWDLSGAEGHGDAEYAARAKALLDAGPHKIAHQAGDADAALARAAKTITARYDYPFLAHMTLEPQNCTAQFKDGRMEIWAPCQQPGQGLDMVVKTLGLAPEAVTIHLTRIGGGFGRRLMNDYLVIAAAIAKQVPDVPIQLLYNRTDDIRHDFYRPAGWHSFTAGIDAGGKMVAFKNHFVSFGPKDDPQFFANMPDGHFPMGMLPDYAFGTSVFPSGIPLGALRAPGSNALCFAFQCFLDEVARAGGRDLPTLALELLAQDRIVGEKDRPEGAPHGFNTARARAVTQKVLAMCNWGKAALPPGTGRGFAVYFCHQGYFAEVVEATVKGKAVTINKVWAAGDVGRQIVNPMGAEAQVMGAILDGLSQALDGQRVDIKDGAIRQSNFGDYRVGRIGRRPDIELAFVTSDFAVSGLGEPALPPVIAALANAIFDATGTRLRSMPLQLS